MPNGPICFSAVFRDGRIEIGGKTYAAGCCAVNLLNKFYVDDLITRITCRRDWLRFPLMQMEKGFLDAHLYIIAGENIIRMLDALQAFPPFDILKIGCERQRVFELFMGENGDRIEDTFQYRGKVAGLDYMSKSQWQLPEPEYYYPELVEEAKETLQFYLRIPDDIIAAHEKLLAFVSQAAGAERFDEAHLLPIATEVFGSVPFPVRSEYIAIPKSKNSHTKVTARRLTFDSYLSFIITDFFEGLHHGHYPRLCPICEKYFLMQSARRQQYCNGTAPEKYKGKSISCRKYAILLGQKERAANDPVKDAYAKRCAAIRAEKSKGKLPADDAAGLLEFAKSRMERAMEDEAYAKEQYSLDMAREKLYSDYRQAI